jgi:hypothetical protein
VGQELPRYSAAFLESNVPGGGIYCNGAHVAEIPPIGVVYDELTLTENTVFVRRRRF